MRRIVLHNWFPTHDALPARLAQLVAANRDKIQEAFVEYDLGHPSYWLHLRQGWICGAMESGTIHEDTVAAVLQKWKSVHKEGARDILPVNSTGKSASEWSRVMSDLREKKPRPINKLWNNPAGAPPEQVAAQEQRIREWNRAYNRASKMQKKALEEDNENFRRSQRTNDAISDSTKEALAEARRLDPLKYFVGIKGGVRLVPDTDNWNAEYDFDADRISFQKKFEAKDYADKLQTFLHEIGHRGQATDPKTYKAFCEQGLGSVKNFLAMCNKTHRDDYEKNGIENPDEEAFAESYARFALGLPMPDAIKAFWKKRVGTKDATIPRYLQHFTQTRNIESIKKNGLEPRGYGKVFAEKAIDPPGPHKEHTNHSVVYIDTHHPAAKSNNFKSAPYYASSSGREYTTSKPIKPEALVFNKPQRDVRRPYDPASREYTGKEPVAAAIKNHPGVQEVEISGDSSYKYEVFLKEGWSWENGRNAGSRTGFFHNVAAFRHANPVRE